MKHETRYRLGRRASVLGIVGNIFLAGLKLAAGIVGTSTAMIADALHSASDVLVSGIVFFSLHISRKPADSEHPYGHGKAEVIASKIIAVFLVLMGLGLVSNAGEKIMTGGIDSPGIIALWGAIISLVIKEMLFRYSLRVARRTKSSAVEANAWEHRSDAVTSLAAFFGIAGSRLGYPVLDPVGGIVVALFIIRVGYRLGKKAVNTLMDTQPRQELIERLRHLALEEPGVRDLSGVRVRYDGPYLRVDMEIMVESKLTVEKGHEIADGVAERIMRTREDVADVMVHVNPDTNREL